MKPLLFSLLLATPALALANPAPAPGPLRICYFSLNEEREELETRRFMENIQRVHGLRVEVREFLTRGGNPAESFRKMVESGTRCDGLVISGHHTGSWGGHRAGQQRKLSMDFIESLSCDPKHAAWFQSINAAWLQGCRTLGVGEIAADDEQYDADHQTNRVGQVLEADNLGGGFAELNMEYSTTMDQDNPLASRYLRMFPAAKLFGWTKSAPGEKAKSYRSILYHMAQTARLMDGDAFPTQAPSERALSPLNAARYANAMLLTLSRFSADDRACENMAVQGWLAHGNVGRPRDYFFDNPDLKALPSLNASGDADLLKAKEIDCLLKAAAREPDAAKLQAKVNAALGLIAGNPTFMRYSFNTLVDLRNQLASNRDPKRKEMAARILARMKATPGLTDFLKEKMQSRQVGLMRKIDYYRFHLLLTGAANPAMEAAIRAKALAELSRELPPAPEPLALGVVETPVEATRRRGMNRSRQLAQAYRASMIQSLIKNRLGGAEFYRGLLAAKPEVDVLQSLARHGQGSDPQGFSAALRAETESQLAARGVASTPAPAGEPLTITPRPQNTDPVGNFFRGLFRPR